jgi:hypothetical protein
MIENAWLTGTTGGNSSVGSTSKRFNMGKSFQSCIIGQIKNNLD